MPELRLRALVGDSRRLAFVCGGVKGAEVEEDVWGAPAADVAATSANHVHLRELPVEDHDALLVARMANGEEQALVELYDRWHLVVHAIVSQIVHVSSDMEDVIEAAFWQSWREAHRYASSRGGVREWLSAIARSRALDCARSATRRREQPHPGHDNEQLVTLVAEDNPAMDVEHAERRSVVIAALDSLPADQREAVELGYFQGMSESEIARHLGLPLGTVKTRIRLGLRRLRGAVQSLRASVPGSAHGLLPLSRL